MDLQLIPTLDLEQAVLVQAKTAIADILDENEELKNLLAQAMQLFITKHAPGDTNNEINKFCSGRIPVVELEAYKLLNRAFSNGGGIFGSKYTFRGRTQTSVNLTPLQQNQIKILFTETLTNICKDKWGYKNAPGNNAVLPSSGEALIRAKASEKRKTKLMKTVQLVLVGLLTVLIFQQLGSNFSDKFSTGISNGYRDFVGKSTIGGSCQPQEVIIRPPQPEGFTAKISQWYNPPEPTIKLVESDRWQCTNTFARGTANALNVGKDFLLGGVVDTFLSATIIPILGFLGELGGQAILTLFSILIVLVVFTSVLINSTDLSFNFGFIGAKFGGHGKTKQQKVINNITAAPQRITERTTSPQRTTSPRRITERTASSSSKRRTR